MADTDQATTTADVLGGLLETFEMLRTEIGVLAAESGVSREALEAALLRMASAPSGSAELAGFPALVGGVGVDALPLQVRTTLSALLPWMETPWAGTRRGGFGEGAARGRGARGGGASKAGPQGRGVAESTAGAAGSEAWLSALDRVVLRMEQGAQRMVDSAASAGNVLWNRDAAEIRAAVSSSAREVHGERLRLLSLRYP